MKTEEEVLDQYKEEHGKREACRVESSMKKQEISNA